ncbi:MAG: hypothetical protein JNK64_25395 [Myxococcales bacterium]|nr:hypothetical protein [Myxococcales bacterium]
MKRALGHMDLDLVGAACVALGTHRYRLVEAQGRVPSAPGLYAVFGSLETWRLLGLGVPPDDRPLYVGKAERSLASRDLNTHFHNGRTGQSTVRRTFAALLRDELSLRAIPRGGLTTADKPSHFALDTDADAELTSWMLDRLTLAVWEKPARCADLAVIEWGVIKKWVPPLNIQGNAGSPWIAEVRRARQVMAADAVRARG